MAEQGDLVLKNTRTFGKGEHLFCQNDTTRELYIIKNGSVRIFKKEGNLEVNLDTLGPGSLIVKLL